MEARHPAVEALDASEQLAASGRLLKAIDLLTERNRQWRNPLLEMRLVRLRHQAFEELDTSTARREWPPRFPDPFPSSQGSIPEISASELSLEVMAGAILHHGSLLVRGWLGTERAAELVAGIDRALEGLSAFRQGVGYEQTSPWYQRFRAPGRKDMEFGRAFVDETKTVVLACDSPRMTFEVLEVFEACGLRELLAEYFGERPVLSARKWSLRRVPPDTTGAWHQDGAFLGSREMRTINVWVSLSTCGEDAPGIEVVPARVDRMVEPGTEGATFPWSVSNELVDRIDDGRRPHLVFEPGDALLFDQWTMHRTGVNEHMTRDRYAIEAWFFAPSVFPDRQVPIVF